MELKNLKAGIFGGSIVLLIMVNMFNALNYFFHFVMARLLISSDYGILATLMSMLFIFNLANEAVQTIVTKYTSNEKDIGKIKNILKRSLKKSLKIAIVLFFAYLIAAIFLSNFLRIQYSLLALTGLLVLTVFLLPVTRGILQGWKKFSALGWNMIFEATVKLSLAIALVYVGWRVYGAILGVIIGAVFAFALSFINIKDILKSKEKDSKMKETFSYSMNVFVVIATITIFYSLDVILARRFFSDDVAGFYAIASVLAKSIYFATAPISKAMFPLSSEAAMKGEQSRHVFKKSIVILCFCIAVALVAVALFPDLLVRIFSGSYHPESASILLYVAIAISLISFTNIILLYKLSLNKNKSYKRIFFFLLAEIVLLSAFHGSLFEYSMALLAANVIFLIGSILLFNKR